MREEPVELAPQEAGQLLERLHRLVVGGREAAADVEEVHLGVAALLGLLEDPGRQLERRHVVVEVGGLAADVEGEPLDLQPLLGRRQDEVDRLARRGAELGGELHHRPGVGDAEAQRQPGVRGVLLDLLDLLQVVEGDQGPVAIELAERLVGLDRVGVDDLVPDPLLPLLVRHLLDELVDDHELGEGGHVEARPALEERLDDGRIRVGLHRVVGLDPGEVLPEVGVVPPERRVVHHEERRAVLAGELLQLRRGDHGRSGRRSGMRIRRPGEPGLGEAGHWGGALAGLARRGGGAAPGNTSRRR